LLQRTDFLCGQLAQSQRNLRGGQGVEIEGSVFILDDRIAEFKVIK